MESTEEALTAGLDFFLTRLVDPDGAVRASPESRYPVDIHSCASSIWALSDLHERDRDPSRLRAASSTGRLRTCAATTGASPSRSGASSGRPFPYARWSDGHMLLALSEYLTATADG